MAGIASEAESGESASGLAVFISYRREDTAGYAGRLYDDLKDRMNRSRLFMDVDTIEPGEDFVDALTGAVSQCDVLLALIGPQWLSVTDEGGARRIDDEMDFVRLEVAAALDGGKRVIPLLFQGVRMPRAHELPDALRPLARREALELSHGRWAADVDLLVRTLARAEQRKREVADAEQRRRSEQPVPAWRPAVQPTPPAVQPTPAAVQPTPDAVQPTPFAVVPLPPAGDPAPPAAAPSLPVVQPAPPAVQPAPHAVAAEYRAVRPFPPAVPPAPPAVQPSPGTGQPAQYPPQTAEPAGRTMPLAGQSGPYAVPQVSYPWQPGAPAVPPTAAEGQPSPYSWQLPGGYDPALPKPYAVPPVSRPTTLPPPGAPPGPYDARARTRPTTRTSWLGVRAIGLAIVAAAAAVAGLVGRQSSSRDALVAILLATLTIALSPLVGFPVFRSVLRMLPGRSGWRRLNALGRGACALAAGLATGAAISLVPGFDSGNRLLAVGFFGGSAAYIAWQVIAGWLLLRVGHNALPAVAALASAILIPTAIMLNALPVLGASAVASSVFYGAIGVQMLTGRLDVGD